jgi:hypothetical protein
MWYSVMNATSTLCKLGRAYLSFGADLWTSSLRITSSYALRAVDQALAGVAEQSQPKLLNSSILELQNYCTEMATVIPFAIERFGTDEPLMMAHDEEHREKIGFAPHPAKSYLVGDKPIMLPVRIGEASQGWALYFVSSDWAQSQLKEQDKQFTVVDAGTGRTPLVIFGIDHRESDLGPYQEIGVALFVRPRSNPLDLPGLLFLSLTVNEQFTIDASRAIWGYHKSLARNMAVRYEANFATFCVDAHDSTAFSISFPRFGRGRSSRIPCYIYSVPNLEKNGVAHRTVLSRSATSEGIQISGSVELQLGDGSQTNCVCRSDSCSDNTCICSILRDLRLSERPAANGWAQFMSGTFGPPTSCT